ncbi:hypothetical protein PPERSA_06084 [Pseudocohnilembus persalinus]|uniref:Uncharacterized protein n=1 Tax=Pseudocohnilembus persalinus TaxID=266149 RepID=A0A0V0QVX1_PSEPJ|nr:hypothetical protein PPERSA_06084 [Pseudocohnilembus persalinus]|eukprot:KRX06202.1 hypothetical protein PPERSA_06084 [Pseudocohnilembus persalinus]
MEEENNYEYFEKDSRNKRITEGDNCKKRLNKKENVIREEKIEKRQQQSLKDRGYDCDGVEEQKDDFQKYMEMERKQKEKKLNKKKGGISDKLSKQDKKAILLEDEQAMKSGVKGKQKMLLKSRLG